MSRRTPLQDGSPRILDNHNSVEGRIYRQGYRLLAQDLGPFETPLLRAEAGRVAVHFVNLQVATRAIMAARRERRVGRGRRPSARDLERLSRRQALADASYGQALEKLRALVQATRPKMDLASRLARAQHVYPTPGTGGVS
jgi:hypothetical protein